MWVIALLSLTGEAQSEPSERQLRRAARWTETARAQLEAGQRGRAARSLRKALEVTPNAAARLELYAQALLAGDPARAAWPSKQALRSMERFQKAVRDARPGPDATPEQMGAWRRVRFWRQWAAAVRGRLGGAIEESGRMAGIQDLLGSQWLRRLAALAVHRGDLAAAERALVLARQVMPQDPEISAELGALRLARGRAHAALAPLREVLKRDQANLGARRDLAGALLASGRPAEALELLMAAGEACSQHTACLLDTARVALEGQRLEVAAEAALLALQQGPQGDPEPALLLAESRARQGRKDDAERAYREALRRRPNHPRARQGLSALMAGATPAP